MENLQWAKDRILDYELAYLPSFGHLGQKFLIGKRAP